MSEERKTCKKRPTKRLYYAGTYLSPDRFWAHITVADGRHGDCGPPERRRDASVASTRHILLSKIGKAGEDW